MWPQCRAPSWRLVGPLGAGKTQLAKGIAEGLGITGVVNSPTFVLMNEHAGRLRMYHVDAYRLDDPEEASAAGLLDDRQSDGVTVVEWADRLHGWMPVERLDIRLSTPAGDPTAPHARLAGARAGSRQPRAGGACHLVIIAIDAASTDLSVALAEPDGTLIAEDAWSSAQRQSAELFPRLLALLAGAGRPLVAATALAVGTGPGSFTGLQGGHGAGQGAGDRPRPAPPSASRACAPGSTPSRTPRPRSPAPARARRTCSCVRPMRPLIVDRDELDSLTGPRDRGGRAGGGVRP